MPGYTTHDGKITGNRQQVESYDHAHGKKSSHEGKDGKEEKHKKKADGTSHDGTESHGGSIHEVVAEHGHAHTHTITKHRDGEHPDGMTHHSETHHEDGHIHHADHGSLEEAHEHGMAAMDTEHGEMDKDDLQVEQEEENEDMHHGKTESIGFMR